jgi:hypothetical protein
MNGDRLSETARENMHILVQDYMKAIQKRSTQHHKNFTTLGKARKYDTSSIVDPFKNHDFNIKYQDYISTGESDSIKSSVNKGDTAVTLAQRIRNKNKPKKK